MTQAWIKFLSRFIVVGVVGTLAFHFGGGWAYRTFESREQALETARALVAVPLERASEVIREAIPATPDASETTTPALDSAPSEPEPALVECRKTVSDLLAGKQFDAALEQAVAGLKRWPRDTDLLALRKTALSGATQWGVVTVPGAVVLNHGGQSIGKLPAGAVVIVQEIRTASQGTYAICSRVWTNGPAFKPPFYVQARELALTPGKPETADPERIRLVSRRAQIRIRIAALRQTQSATINTANPHAKAYEAARTAYNRFRKKAETLNKQFDDATGDERMKLHDQLRQLKLEQVGIEQQYQKARKPYAAWQAGNAPAASPSDPRVQEMEKELNQVESALAALQSP